MTLAPHPRAHDRDPREDQRKLMNTLLARAALPVFYAASVAAVWATLPGGVAAAPSEATAAVSFSVLEYAVFFALVLLATWTRGTAYYLPCKLLPMAMLLFKATAVKQPLFWWGLLLGMCGDAMLVFRGRWRPALIVGAWFFLFGHMAYLGAFAAAPLSMGKEYWVSWMGLFLIFMHEYYYFMLRTAPFLEFVFGLLYWTGISVMLVAAGNAQHLLLSTLPPHFPFALVGAFLFVISDLCIHWMVYVRPNDKLVQSLVLPTYYVAQLLILKSSDQLALLNLA